MPSTSDEVFPTIRSNEIVGVPASISTLGSRQSAEILVETDLYHPCPDGETSEFIKHGDSYVGEELCAEKCKDTTDYQSTKKSFNKLSTRLDPLNYRADYAKEREFRSTSFDGDNSVTQRDPENRDNTDSSRWALDYIDQCCFGFETKQDSYDLENDLESSPATTNSNLKKRVSFLFDSSESIGSSEQDLHEINNIDENLDFHEACFSCTSLEDIKQALQEALHRDGDIINTLATKDPLTGKYPLHLVSQNTSVLNKEGHAGELVDSFIISIILAYPEALITVDKEGYIPFARTISNWVKAIHDSSDVHTRPKKSFRSMRSFGWSTRQLEPLSQKGQDWDTIFPKVMAVPLSVDRSFRILSLVLDRLIESDRIFQRFDNGCDQNKRVELYGFKVSEIIKKFVSHVALIPSCLKSILLLEEKQCQEKMLNYSIMKKVMLSEDSVGSWITSMLKSKLPKVQEELILYLEKTDFLIGSLNEEKGRCHGSEDAQNKFIGALELSSELIPSMIFLKHTLMERVSCIPIIQIILDREIKRPFAMTVLFFDWVFLLILIYSFRCTVDGFINTSLGLHVFVIYYGTVISCCFHFLNREAFKASSMSRISKKSFWSNFGTFWSMIDISSIIVTLLATIGNLFWSEWLENNHDESWRIVLAIATGLLWIKLISFLKVLNRQLATFVLSIMQIARDILWFLLILLILIIAFTQMFYTVLPPRVLYEDGDTTGLNNIWEYYVLTYMIVLGEFDRQTFKNTFSVILFCLYTFWVVIIMLNVLIAIVGDSYEKSTVRSESLFGRARIIAIGELVAMEKLLKPNSTPTGNGTLLESLENRKWGLIPLWMSPISIIFLYTATGDKNHHGSFSALGTNFQKWIINFVMTPLLGKGIHKMSILEQWKGLHTKKTIEQYEKRANLKLLENQNRLLSELSVMEQKLEITRKVTTDTIQRFIVSSELRSRQMEQSTNLKMDKILSMLEKIKED